MARSRRLPKHARIVRTYRDLAQFARAFSDGHLNLLLLFGDPGLGKSRCVRETVGADACWGDGNASAFGIYQAAFAHRDEPIVLDDVDSLYRDRDGIRLLKALCQSEPMKRVSWNTNAPALERDGIPRQFETSSRVVIIANEWKTLNANVAALQDRGHLIQFAPTALEVHRRAGEWFWCQEIYDFVARHLHLYERHSLRTYSLAWELKSAGMDWQSGVLERCLTGAALEVAAWRAVTASQAGIPKNRPEFQNPVTGEPTGVLDTHRVRPGRRPAGGSAPMGRREESLKLTGTEIATSFGDSLWATKYPPVMTVDQAADLLQVPKQTIYDWSSRGLLKGCSRRVGKHLRFYRDRLISKVFDEGLDANGK